ncbi:MAG: substrate-binding domain-containing protein [Saprospiraceae bacterium]
MKYLLLLSCLGFGWIGCKNQVDSSSSPTKGRISILCDEALKGIVEQEEQIFERDYPNSDVDILYVSDSMLFKQFIFDSSEIIISSRKLNAEELGYLDKQKNLHPKIFPFAVSAIAFINSINSTDSTLNYDSFINTLQGKDKQNSKTYVIECANSGLAGALMNFAQVKELPNGFYAQNSSLEVIDYVINHPKSIGIIDWSRVSDSDDPKAKALLEKLNIIKINQPKDSIQYGYLRPYQYNLQDNKYPFTKTLYFISRSGKSDLGLGFASFITGEIGQRILLKAGLLPIFQTDRLIELRSSSDPKVVR